MALASSPEIPGPSLADGGTLAAKTGAPLAVASLIDGLIPLAPAFDPLSPPATTGAPAAPDPSSAVTSTATAATFSVPLTASTSAAAVQAPADVSGQDNTAAKSTQLLSVWETDWRTKMASTACGSCTGRNCTMCSIRIGGPTAANGMPSGYAVRVLELYQPVDTSEGIGTTVPGTTTPALQTFTPPTSALPNALFTTNAVEVAPQAAAAANPIVAENLKQGTPEDIWMVNDPDSSIEGFADQFSINHGQTENFKINTDSTNYRIDIYRLGYYGGDGATLVTSISKKLTTAQLQPTPLFDPTTKLVDAGNWSVSASWAIPANAVSGVYIADLVRLDGSKGENMIPFVVRDDEAPSDITFQTSDTTWEAYNSWGGYNFYGGVDASGHAGRAYAVSYNRPFITRQGGYDAGPQDFVFGEEYPAIRWLEENGYDVNYIAGVDTARSGQQLLNSNIFLSVGHDEYWSADQRANVEAARDAGVNLAFMSGNEVYWETRWAPSISAAGTPYTTLVSYKERWANDNIDTQATTSTWRDPQLGAGEPENGLTGTIFTVDSYRLDTIQIPYDLSNFRFWSNTDVANLQPGQVYSLTPNLLGYEWDSDLDNGSRPAGLVPLSDTTVNVNTLLLDYGSTTGPGTSTHSLTLYRAPSGALVFGAGTVYWSWGLDNHHDNESTPTDPNVQQAMVNLFADMGVQPATLMQSLAVAQQTTDHAAPVSAITSPTTTGTYAAGQAITVTGTATDSGGGLVAVVEVSTDGGTTWHRATGYNNWSYSWTPLAGGSYTIKSRAVDDSVNLETPSAGRTITVAPAAVTSMFRPTDAPADISGTDLAFVNLGMRFTSSQSGSVVGVKFYKGVGDGGAHVGSLWSSSGQLLASVTFTGETASGWQTATFANPVQISAGTTYTVSYHSNGQYDFTDNYFTTAVTNGPLTAPAGNGYYSYGNSNAFPTVADNGTNYWVDVVFSGTNTVNSPPVGVNDNGYVVALNTPITVQAATLLANDSDPNGDILTVTGAGAASGGTVVFNSQTSAITFTPTAGYVGAASFGYSISDGRGGTGSAIVNMTVGAVTLFSNSDTPAVLSDSDASPVNLGVQFVASQGGQILGIKYYKGPSDTGTHTGSLWSSTGTLLATATFTNETTSGWQTVTFSNPVTITAGTTYVASYHSNGHYTATSGYFNTAHTSGPLTASTSNGLYTYGTGNVFPTSTFGGSNYWVDVVYAPSGTASTNQPPVAANDSGFSTQQNTALQFAAASLLANDTDPNGDPLIITGVSGATNGTVAFNAQTNVVTYTPTTGYTGAGGFIYAISDGKGGTASANVSLTVTATTPPPTGVSLFAANATPAIITDTDPSSVELGMKFTVAANGTISGIRFYKGPQNTGSHTGSLWSSTGTLLGSLTFGSETASGWQTATFASPLNVVAGTTYVVSYHTNGGYSANTNYFGSAVTNGPITAPSSTSSGGNGVYAYGSSSIFPTNTYNATNYWVDVVYQQGATAVNQPPVANNDSGFSTAQNTALQLTAASLLGNDTDPNGDTLTITGVNAPSNGAVTYNAQTNVVSFTPTSGYTGAAGFTYAISDGKGGTASANVALTVTATTPPPTGVSLFAANATPAIITDTDPSPVELGMKFTASQNGTISGIRFYKGPQNTGTHTGSLWTSTGTKLGTVTFTNETASGWQTANLTTPISITAGTTYVVSYHTNGGYSSNENYFGSAVTSGPLTALSSSSSGGNGVYAYGSGSAFPTSSYNASNYWVDVVFNGQLAA
ncbi:MAG TPA: DUF4082 domain-containing protein [Devosiaceae bacterium]|nr:DUF4082 domain-containing protein [Devosiaceae bacterium]